MIQPMNSRDVRAKCFRGGVVWGGVGHEIHIMVGWVMKSTSQWGGVGWDMKSTFMVGGS